MSAVSNRPGDENPLAATRRWLRNGAAVVVLGMAVLASGLVSDQALAQPPEPPAAESETPQGTPTTGVAYDKANGQQTSKATRAYMAGVKAMKSKKLDEALAKFRQSYGVVASPNSRHMIMRVLYEAGRYVEAYHEALATIEEAEAASKKAAKYKKTADAARSELEAVKAELVMVTVNVEGAPEGATLSVAGREIPATEWGKEMVLTPGTIEVILSTEVGKEVQEVRLVAGRAKVVDIAPPKPKVVEKDVAEEPVEAEGGYTGPDRVMMAIIAGGVGVVGLVSFGVFGAMSSSKHKVLEDHCNNTTMTCDLQYEDDANSGATLQVVANVSAVVGFVGLAAGAGLFLWEINDSDEEDGDTALRPRISIGPGAISVSGSF